MRWLADWNVPGAAYPPRVPGRPSPPDDLKSVGPNERRFSTSVSAGAESGAKRSTAEVGSGVPRKPLPPQHGNPRIAMPAPLFCQPAIRPTLPNRWWNAWAARLIRSSMPYSNRSALALNASGDLMDFRAAAVALSRSDG